MTTAAELIAAGDPRGALELLQRQVREHAADAKSRVFLFQLLCVLGQWPRALTQLQVCGELDAAALPMVNAYREAVQAEAVREAVFTGKAQPLVLGPPQAWVALLVQALQADGDGDGATASRLRAEAFEAAPATPGSLNAEAFSWIADADSRLGPVLEVVVEGRYAWVPFAAIKKVAIDPPTDLRDLVWVSARLELMNGGERPVLLPARYPGIGVSADAGADSALQLCRRTEWLEIGPDQYRGSGQRLLTTDGPEIGLLEVREIVMQAPSHAEASR